MPTAGLPEGLVLQRPLGWHFCHGKLILFNLYFCDGILMKMSLKTCSEKHILLEQCIPQISFAFSYQFLVHSSSLLKIHEKQQSQKLLDAFFREERGEGKKRKENSLWAQPPCVHSGQRGPISRSTHNPTRAKHILGQKTNTSPNEALCCRERKGSEIT